MKSSTAIDHLLSGGRIRRSSWPTYDCVAISTSKESHFISMEVPQHPSSAHIQKVISATPYLVYSDIDGYTIGFIPSVADLLATDWELI